MRVVVALLMLCSAGAAHAESVTGTIPVSLSVLPACRVATAPLAFTATGGERAEAQTPIEVTCSSETPVTVALDNGHHPVDGRRHLAGADGALVPYSLHQGASQSEWDGHAYVSHVATSGPLQLVVYGRIMGADTAVAPGEYRDTITVTLSF